MHRRFLDTLESIVGPNYLLRAGDLSAYEKPWRGAYFGRAAAVVRPKSTLEVASIVKACAAEGVAIVPQGGNTGLVGGGIPDASGRQIVVQLGRMNAVRDLDEHNMTVTVEAGCVLAALQVQTREAGFLFPLRLGAEGSCMLGGNLATNAGGTQVLRYGNARELCLGLEVVTPNGDIMHGLSGLRKDNTGYDLRDLFIGSEGTLGIITAATMKLFPLPVAVVTSWATVSDLHHAVALLSLARKRLGQSLSGFEVMNSASLQLVVRHIPQLRVPFSNGLPPYSILLECDDFESDQHGRALLENFYEEALEQGLVEDILVAETMTQARQFWDVREHIPVAGRMDAPSIPHDISIAISKIPAFVECLETAIESAFPGARIINLGHFGDGNLHINIQAAPNDDQQHFIGRANEVSDVVYGVVHEFGGSFSAEHGVGSTKVKTLQRYKDPTALLLMRSIKSVLDPQNLFNPGRVLPGLP